MILNRTKGGKTQLYTLNNYGEQTWHSEWLSTPEQIDYVEISKNEENRRWMDNYLFDMTEE